MRFIPKHIFDEHNLITQFANKSCDLFDIRFTSFDYFVPRCKSYSQYSEIDNWKQSVSIIHYYLLEFASVHKKQNSIFVFHLIAMWFFINLRINIAIGNPMIFKSCMSNDFQFQYRSVYLAIVCRPTDRPIECLIREIANRTRVFQILYIFLYLWNVVCAQCTHRSFISGIESSRAGLFEFNMRFCDFVVTFRFIHILYINVPCTYHIIIIIIIRATLLR